MNYYYRLIKAVGFLYFASHVAQVWASPLPFTYLYIVASKQITIIFHFQRQLAVMDFI